MEVLAFFISVALLVAAYVVATHLRHKNSNLPPTVFPTLPIIGHLYLLKKPIHRTFAKITGKHGPVVLLRFGSRPVLLVSSPAAAEDCFTKNDIVFANRPRMLFGKINGNNYTSLFWAPYGDHWRNLRRLSSIEILSSNRLNEFQHIRLNECRLLVRKLLSVSSDQPVDMKRAFHELTLNVIMRMVSGKRYFGGDMKDVGEEGKMFKEILDEASLLAGAANIGDYLPVLSWLGAKGLEKQLIALQEKRDAFFQRLIDQLRAYKRDESENKKKTMIEVLLSLQESDPDYYTDELIRSLFQVLLSAGTDTTAGTMEWILSLLLNHPQVLAKAQNEIDSHVGKDRLVEESDMPSLPYLRCVINETMRLYPAGALIIPHESSEDCVVGGYNVPRGTMLLVNQWAITRDPKLWSHPERFDPERFSGIEGSRDGFKMMPFGFGRRGCPGEGLAMRMLGLSIGSLIQCFEWERIGEELVDLTETTGVNMTKVEPLMAKCKPRPMIQHLLSHI